jgi:hypothetical protein
MDFSAVPRGQIEWTSLIATLSATDDRAERHFLEMKSDVDLTQAAGRAKMVKFILGASNRDPNTAARYFDGHALLVLGVARGSVLGIPPFEAHELTRFAAKYLGTPGPRWDFVRIPAKEGRDVIIVVVDPPTGETWTCLSDGPERLTDGAIFVRADGETRLAKGAEIRALLARSRQNTMAADVAVDVVGQAVRHPSLYHEVREAFLAAHDEQLSIRPRKSARSNSGFFPEETTSVYRFGLPERRSRDEYVAEVEMWVEQVRAAWPTLLDHLAGFVGHGTYLKITNNSDAFLEDVEVKVHLEGDVRAVDAVTRDEIDLGAQLPAVPKRWGSYTDFYPLRLSPISPRRTPRRSGNLKFRIATAGRPPSPCISGPCAPVAPMAPTPMRSRSLSTPLL